MRIAPSFTEQVPLREAHRAHPLFNLAWQEVFGVLGGERNLGVSGEPVLQRERRRRFPHRAGFSEHHGAAGVRVGLPGRGTTTTTASRPSINVKTDYRLSASTKLSLNAVSERRDRDLPPPVRIARAFTAQTVGTTGTAGILPGYTNRVTQVRASTASTIDITTTGPGNFYNRMRRLDFGVEQQFGRLQLDYNALYTQTNINGGGGGARRHPRQPDHERRMDPRSHAVGSVSPLHPDGGRGFHQRRELPADDVQQFDSPKRQRQQGGPRATPATSCRCRFRCT